MISVPARQQQRSTLGAAPASREKQRDARSGAEPPRSHVPECCKQRHSERSRDTPRPDQPSRAAARLLYREHKALRAVRQGTISGRVRDGVCGGICLDCPRKRGSTSGERRRANSPSAGWPGCSGCIHLQRGRERAFRARRGSRTSAALPAGRGPACPAAGSGSRLLGGRSPPATCDRASAGNGLPVPRRLPAPDSARRSQWQLASATAASSASTG
jgi:hypothetical protein